MERRGSGQLCFFVQWFPYTEPSPKNVNGYIYSAYYIRLDNIRDKLGASYFNNPNYTIWMDSYNMVIERGTPKGGVSDGGSTWGEVYSTYDGIANARG